LEPISTLNFGASLAQQSEVFPVKGLAAKARQLVGSKNSSKGNESNTAQALNRGQDVATNQASKDKELMEVAKKFEAILIHQMLKAMRKTVHKSELLNSFSLQQYESMMDEEIASEMVKHKGIGLADSLFYQLSRLEKDSNLAAPISSNLIKANPYE
jgi:Rod binding domain-containing protein